METVLILEIESRLRIFYKEELEEEGYQILLAENEK
jgi:DNA-binding response OmpR family regulator